MDTGPSDTQVQERQRAYRACRLVFSTRAIPIRLHRCSPPASRVARGRFRQLTTWDPAGRALYHRIEREEISQADFERDLAVLLGSRQRGCSAAWHLTARLSRRRPGRGRPASGWGITNSWGTDPYDPYASYHLSEQYDAVVISGEVGLRKPDPAIYLLAAEKLGLPASQCVFVDDVAANLPAAAELGMATVHHVNSTATVRELDRLFSIGL